MNAEDIENDKHCSFCRKYVGIHQTMYCTYLKKRITARKKTCKEYDDIRIETNI